MKYKIMLMTEKLKIRKVGNSLGLILSQSILKSLNLGEGDEIFLVKTANGMMITPYDPAFANALEDAQEFMKSHRNALKKLAE